ncbi:urea ABC transporter ATP-binding subunit UrtE [Roseovarius sp. 10]|uniref:urea ABC transporter ATP-binding subunit UrtE n=1 Tax=Roseovarius sp. 10 TaxID=3080563 RepID=UPI002953632B|nr:urea ABC transporter ATP-binding subunit UrtE [Roseovarius sp. 10]MDV7202418.1 urea ABC transporter ATP-binding subunit UrtE [Roseovarius sp. 10]
MPLTVSSLSQSYGTAIILEDIGFQIDSLSCSALLGRNGAGKTTLLRTLMGVMPTRSGNIMFDGSDLTRAPSHVRARAGIGYVPQGREIFSDLTVGQNIDIVLRNHRTPDPDSIKEELTNLFPVLGQMWRRRGGDLSGGQQQQLAIARALAPRPKLLVLDEPTEGVQPSIVEDIENAIAALKGRMAILLVEQYYDFARSLADSYVVLDRGRIVLRGAGCDMETDGVPSFLSV